VFPVASPFRLRDVTASRPCHVSSPRHVERNVRISRTTLTCLFRPKAYATYDARARPRIAAAGGRRRRVGFYSASAARKRIEVTRSRAYKKNDQPFVEHKSGDANAVQALATTN
jgi:hypothetical protein